MWDPFDEMRRLQKEMNKAFGNFFRESTKSIRSIEGGFSKYKEPASDIVETNKDVIVAVDLPGMDKKDIVLKVTENMVEIQAQKKEEMKVEKKGFFKHERSYSGFHRVLSLPATVKSEDAKAEYKNGILKITVPKKQPTLAVKKKVIKIR